MNLSYLKNNKGITLTELIVTMGISSILLIFIISGSLFIKNYIKKQNQNNKIYEELSFIQNELEKSISSGRSIVTQKDSLIVISKLGVITTYNWQNHTFTRNDHPLLSHGMSIESLSVQKIQLPKTGDSTILKQDVGQIKSGVYEVFIKISDSKQITDSINTIVLNNYETIKYKQ